MPALGRALRHLEAAERRPGLAGYTRVVVLAALSSNVAAQRRLRALRERKRLSGPGRSWRS